jgi:hypothetical protein
LRMKSANPQGAESLRGSERGFNPSFRNRTLKLGAQTLYRPQEILTFPG